MKKCQWKNLGNQMSLAILNLLFTIIAFIWIIIMNVRKVRDVSLMQTQKPRSLEDRTLHLLQVYRIEVEYYLVWAAILNLVYCIVDVGLAIFLIYKVVKKSNHHLTTVVFPQGALIILLTMDIIIFFMMKEATYKQKINFIFLGLYASWKLILVTHYYLKSHRDYLPNMETSPSENRRINHYGQQQEFENKTEMEMIEAPAVVVEKPEGKTETAESTTNLKKYENEPTKTELPLIKSVAEPNIAEVASLESPILDK